MFTANNLVMFTANGPATFYTATSDVLLDLKEEAESPLYPSMRPNDYGLKRCDEWKVHISYGCLSLSESSVKSEGERSNVIRTVTPTCTG